MNSSRKQFSIGKRVNIGHLQLGPVVDNAIHRINRYSVDIKVLTNYAIHWIVIYRVDSVIHSSSTQPGPGVKTKRAKLNNKPWRSQKDIQFFYCPPVETTLSYRVGIIQNNRERWPNIRRKSQNVALWTIPLLPPAERKLPACVATYCFYFLGNNSECWSNIPCEVKLSPSG